MWSVLKKDIAEFVTVVKTETQEVVTSAVVDATPENHQDREKNVYDRKMFTDDSLDVNWIGI
jgi:hypothetical protein